MTAKPLIVFHVKNLRETYSLFYFFKAVSQDTDYKTYAFNNPFCVFTASMGTCPLICSNN